MVLRCTREGAQIKATRELGWKFIESRKIGAKTLASLSDEEFEQVERLLAEPPCPAHLCAGWSWGHSSN